jgi:hypothetical protein
LAAPAAGPAQPSFSLISSGPDFIQVNGAADIKVTGDALFANPNAENGEISGGLQVGNRLDVLASDTIRIDGVRLAGRRVEGALQGQINCPPGTSLPPPPMPLRTLQRSTALQRGQHDSAPMTAAPIRTATWLPPTLH